MIRAATRINTNQFQGGFRRQIETFKALRRIPGVTVVLGVTLCSVVLLALGTALAERIAENADVLAFLFNQLGMTLPKARDFERSV